MRQAEEEKAQKLFEAFTIHDGLQLSGAKISVTSLQSEPTVMLDYSGNPHMLQRKQECITITATIEVSKSVILDRGLPSTCCDTCGREGDFPDDTALWFMLRHACEHRLVFPRDEGANPQSDVYPMTGWKVVDGALNCPDCASALKQAKAVVKALRKVKG